MEAISQRVLDMKHVNGVKQVRHVVLTVTWSSKTGEISRFLDSGHGNIIKLGSDVEM